MRLIYTATENHVPLDGYNIVGTDISFAAADSSINSTTTDLALGLSVGRYIRVTGSANNDGWYSVASISSANKIIVNEAVADEAAGASILLDGFIHGDGQQYLIEVGAFKLDPVRERDITVQTAPDRTVEVLKHYAGDQWSVSTDYFTDSDLPYFSEFLASTEAFESFQLDLYGSSASPGPLLDVHAITPAAIKRVGTYAIYQMSFSVRVI